VNLARAPRMSLIKFLPDHMPPITIMVASIPSVRASLVLTAGKWTRVEEDNLIVTNRPAESLCLQVTRVCFFGARIRCWSMGRRYLNRTFSAPRASLSDCVNHNIANRRSKGWRHLSDLPDESTEIEPKSPLHT